MANNLYVSSWSYPGYACTFRSFILADSLDRAKLIWQMHLLDDEDDRESWNRCKNNCCGYAKIRHPDESEKKIFKEEYPRRRKEGVYRTAPIRYGGVTDHVYD